MLAVAYGIIVDYSLHYFDMASSNSTSDTQKWFNDIGATIIVVRKQHGMTQEDLAGKAELDRSFLSEIENGKKNFSLSILRKLAHALDVKMSVLLGEN